MDRFLFEELRKKGNEVSNEGENLEMISKVVDAYNRIIDFANIGRREGLLDLEDAGKTLDLEDDTQSLFGKMIKLVVEGTEPAIVKSIGINKCITLNEPSYNGLINLMYVRGALMIQGGDNIWVIQEMLKSMFPRFILAIIEEQERAGEFNDWIDSSQRYQESLRRLSQDDEDIDDTDHSVTAETARVLYKLNEEDFYRVIHVMDRNTLAVAMKAFPGKVRARIFKNFLSDEVKGLINDIEFMGPVRLRDVEEACIEIADHIIDLSESGEITEMDSTIIKITVAMQKENQE